MFICSCSFSLTRVPWGRFSSCSNQNHLSNTCHLSITSHIQLSEILLTPPQKISKICPLLTTCITTNMVQATTSAYLPLSTPDSYRPSSTKKPEESFGSKSEMPLLYFLTPTKQNAESLPGPAGPVGPGLLPLSSHPHPASALPSFSAAFSIHRASHGLALALALDLPTACSRSPCRHSQCLPSLHSACYQELCFQTPSPQSLHPALSSKFLSLHAIFYKWLLISQ